MSRLVVSLRRVFGATSFGFAVFVFFLLAFSVPRRAETSEPSRFPVVRDLWISSASGEESGNNGAAPRLKLKSYQEFSLLDFDVSSLRGKRIERAAIRVKLCGEERLRRVAVGSIVVPWNEGSGTNYEETPGASSFRWRETPNVPWSDAAAPDEYSDITSVIFGEGGSFWSNADASAPDADNWQTIPIDPRLVAARAVELSCGFVLFDDTGTELFRNGANGEDVEIRLFPNRLFYSRDQNSNVAPVLEVFCEENAKENAPPIPAPRNLVAKSEQLPLGDAEISWQLAPSNDRIVGFLATVDGKPVPQSLIPAPKISEYAYFGEENSRRFSTRLASLRLTPGTKKSFELVAVDEFGTKSAPTTILFDVSAEKPCEWNALVGLDATKKNVEKIGDETTTKRSQTTTETRLENDANSLCENKFLFGDSSVEILEEFDKTTAAADLISIRSEKTKRTDANADFPLWNAKNRRIELTAAKNEFVGFQLAISGKAQTVRAEIRWASNVATTGNETDSDDSNEKRETKRQPTSTFYRLAKVETPSGRIGDPALQFDGSSSTLNEEQETIYVETFVPENADSGERFGTLRLTADAETLEISIRLSVWNFALPNELSFFPEMNCYSIPENELDYYRLAQLHRTYLNRVPYSHRGTVGDGLAPYWNAKTQSFDWNDWDRRFGSLFDGSAFADLPRGAVPIEAFYLPLFENFPVDIFANFDETASTVDAAFSDEYKDTFRAASRETAMHFVERGWNGVRFFFFLNNKRDYKKNGWSKASSPWLLDEPATFQDFEALRFFGRLFREGVAEVERSSKSRPILFRADISRPQWRRDVLDGILDVDVVGGGAFRQYNRTVLERKDRFGELVYQYGTASAPDKNGWQPVLWALDAWSRGADGIVPWQTIGTDDSWKNGDELALLYPPTSESAGRVVPSIRLKAFRRGEQDVEYLTALVAATGRPRRDVEQALRRRLPLDATSRFQSSEDAGTQEYSNVSPADLRRWRLEIGEFLSKKFNR